MDAFLSPLPPEMGTGIRQRLSPVTRLALALTCREEYERRGPWCLTYWLAVADELPLHNLSALTRLFARGLHTCNARVLERLLDAGLLGIAVYACDFCRQMPTCCGHANPYVPLYHRMIKTTNVQLAKWAQSHATRFGSVQLSTDYWNINFYDHRCRVCRRLARKYVNTSDASDPTVYLVLQELLRRGYPLHDKSVYY